MRTAISPRAGLGCVVGLSLAVLCIPDARAQETIDWKQDWLYQQDVDFGPAPAAPSASAARQRIPLFRFSPGFINDPVGLQDGDDTPPGTPSATPTLPAEPDSGPDWLQVTLGTDNPYFDFRQPGDPGGLGYYRLNAQVQILDTLRTSCTVNVQAVSPAGLQYIGVADGPTVVSPALALFHALDDNTALQGFIGKNMAVEHAALTPSPVQRSLRCGMAVQRAIAPGGPDVLRNVYFYLGALGRYQPERVDATTTPASLKVLPGLHWRLSSNSWLSGGLLVPVGTGRPDGVPPWQFTWSLHF